MAEDEVIWRPLGVDTEEEIAQYEALHDDVPEWMATTFWEWVKDAMTVTTSRSYNHSGSPTIDRELVEGAAQALGIPMSSVRGSRYYENCQSALYALKKAGRPIQIADYLLAHSRGRHGAALERILNRSRSAWTVGERAGLPGLVPRLPSGVQDYAQESMRSDARAGKNLSGAWAAAFSPTPNPTLAYALAVRAAEDATIPRVVPKQDGATLGHVIGQLRKDADWSLRLTREDPEAPTQETVLGLLRALWKGHHDRHGGDASSEGQQVSLEEAQVAVSLATALVHWFATGLVAREPK